MSYDVERLRLENRQLRERMERMARAQASVVAHMDNIKLFLSAINRQMDNYKRATTVGSSVPPDIARRIFNEAQDGVVHVMQLVSMVRLEKSASVQDIHKN